MRAHAPFLVLAAALCWLIASLGAAPPASAVEEAAASEEAEDTAPSEDTGAQDAGEDPQAAAEATAEEASEEPDAAAEPAEAAGTVLARDERIEQLYVTATKREESLQDVPISMAALDASFLENSGTTKFGQLQQYVPNLRINPITDTRGTIIRIRGIGSVGNNSGIDPSVGVFIDGVYQGRAGMSVGDLLDVERVEVLRGPQGTLYGKNTAAGLIHVISKRPSYEPEATFEGVFGNFANYEGRGSVNYPLVDEHIATRLSGYLVTRDGFDFNFVDGDRVNDDNRWGIKSRTAFDVTDSFSFLLSADYSYQDNKCCVADIISMNGAPTLQDGLLRRPAQGGGDPYDPSTWPELPDPLVYPIDPPNYPNPDLSIPPEDRLDPRWAARSSFQQMEYWRRNHPNPSYPYLDRDFELPVADPFDRRVMADQEPENQVTIGGVSIDATYDIGSYSTIPFLDEASLNFIGAWRHYESKSQFDGDFSLFDAVLAWTDTDLDQFSAELRLSSPGGEAFDYQVGLYFYHQTQDTVDRNGFEEEWVWTWRLITAPAMNIGDNTHKTYSYAAFGQFTLTPVEWLSFTGGLRVTTEKKTRVGTQSSEYFQPPGSDNNVCDTDEPTALCPDAPPILGPNTPRDQSREVANVSWLANLRAFPTQDLMLYASAATGFKSGGFNQLRTNLLVPGEFDDERSLNIEGGFKSTWLEGMLTLNATGFWTKYKDFQAQVFNGSAINVINAATLESYGAEADLLLAPIEYVTIGGSLGFNIAEYGQFENGLATAWQAWESNLYHPDGPMACGIASGDKGINGGASLRDPNPPYWTEPVWNERCVQDLTGKTLDNAPRWSVSTWLQSQYPLPWWPLETVVGPGEVFLRAEYAYTSSRFLDVDLDRNLFQPDTHLLNLRAGVRAANGRWELTGWVKNLTDEKYNVVGFDVPTLNGFAAINGPPRQWGFTLRVNFGALVD